MNKFSTLIDAVEVSKDGNPPQLLDLREEGTGLTEEEYHLLFGLHSGYPLCCVQNFLENKEGGACPKCLSRGRHTHKVHTCRHTTKACAPYLDMVAHNLAKIVQETALLDKKTMNFYSRTPLSDEPREFLKNQGYLLLHLCYHSVENVDYYEYVFCKEKTTGFCQSCKKRFTSSHPATGFSS